MARQEVARAISILTRQSSLGSHASGELSALVVIRWAMSFEAKAKSKLTSCRSATLSGGVEPRNLHAFERAVHQARDRPDGHWANAGQLTPSGRKAIRLIRFPRELA